MRNFMQLGTRRVRGALVTAVVLAAVFAAACGSDRPAAGPTATPTPAGQIITPTATTTPTPFLPPTRTPYAEMLEKLDVARAAWTRSKPSTYSFDLSWSCFCAYEGRITRISVEGNTITSAADPATGRAVSEEQNGPQLTIDGLLQWIQTAFEIDSGEVLHVEFERDLGYPISATIDQVVGATDDTVSFHVTNFRPGTASIDIDRLRKDLQSANSRWFESGHQNYEFVFRWQCFCPPQATSPVKVRVEGGQIASVTDIETGEPVIPVGGLEYQTVEGLFGWIAERLERNPEFVELRFDPETGYPAAASFNYIIQLYDEEEAFVIEGLEPVDIYGALQLGLDAARARWENTGLESYSFRFNWQCFCIDEYVAPVTVTVIDESVHSVIRIEDGEPVAEHLFDGFVTVEALFQRLQDAIDGRSASIRVEFDPEIGIPVEAFIDVDFRMADEEIGWNAGDVERVSPG